MCISSPKPPEPPPAPPVPDKADEDAQRRRAAVQKAQREKGGRNATVLTSPLGDSSFGTNVKRTTLGAG